MANRRTLRRKRQREKKKMFGTTGTISTIAGTTNYVYSTSNGWQLVSNEPQNAAKEAVKVLETNKATSVAKKGKPMCYDCDCDGTESVESERLDYAQGRVRSIAYNKRQDLRKQFNLDPPSTPVDVEEAVQRIKDGKYTILAKEPDRYYWGSYDRLSWRLPDVKPDSDGYEVANKALTKQEADTSDLVTLGDNAAALKALQDFENWTYTAS